MADNSKKSDKDLQNVPQTWPGAFGAYKYSRAAIVFNWKTFLAVVGLTILVSIISGMLAPSTYELSSTTAVLTVADGTREMMVDLVTMLVSVILSVAMTLVILANIKRRQVSLGPVLKDSLQYFFKALLQMILVSLILMASLLLFIVPFFFVLPRMVLALYFLVDQKLGPVEAIKASWNQTRGNSGKVWGVIGVNILIGLLMVTIIGIPFALYFLFMYAAAHGVLYMYITKKPVKQVD